MTYIPTPVQSIQQVSITLNNQLSNTATLSPSVIAANCLLTFQGLTSNNVTTGTAAYAMARAVITNGTTVTASQGATAPGLVIVWNGAIVEFLGPFVKSSGSGTIVIPDGSTSATVTIPSVNPAKTIVAFGGQSVVVVGNIDPQSQLARLDLTNATTITATKAATTATPTTLTVAYSYIELR